MTILYTRFHCGSELVWYMCMYMYMYMCICVGTTLRNKCSYIQSLGLGSKNTWFVNFLQWLDFLSPVQLKCLGPLQHRLTVQGTDDSYMQTKKKMEQAEIERNKNRAQEIKIIKGYY